MVESVFMETDDEADVAAAAFVGDPLGLIDEGLDEKHTHAAGVFLAVHLAVDIGFGGLCAETTAVVDDLDLEGVFAGGEDDADGEVFVEAVAVLDGVDAGLCDSGLEVFDAVVFEAHEFGDGGGGAHGDLFKAQSRGELDLDGAG